MENDLEQFNQAIRQRIIKEDLEYWKSQQKNFSESANLVIEKVQNGKKLNELDIFTLICDDDEKIQEYKKFFDIRESIKDGKLTQEGLDFLVDKLCGNDTDMAKKMKNGFSIYVNNSNSKQK